MNSVSSIYDSPDVAMRYVEDIGKLSLSPISSGPHVPDGLNLQVRKLLHAVMLWASLSSLGNHIGDVISKRSLKEMVGVATGSVVALVKNGQRWVKIIVVESVRNSVSHVLNTSIPNPSVTSGLQGLLPWPALVNCTNLYLRPEPFFSWWLLTPFGNRTHGSPLNSVLPGNHGQTITQGLHYGQL